MQKNNISPDTGIKKEPEKSNEWKKIWEQKWFRYKRGVKKSIQKNILNKKVQKFIKPDVVPVTEKAIEKSKEFKQLIANFNKKIDVLLKHDEKNPKDKHQNKILHLKHLINKTSEYANKIIWKLNKKDSL